LLIQVNHSALVQLPSQSVILIDWILLIRALHYF
jgi:hypothetical protein